MKITPEMLASWLGYDRERIEKLFNGSKFIQHTTIPKLDMSTEDQLLALLHCLTESQLRDAMLSAVKDVAYDEICDCASTAARFDGWKAIHQRYILRVLRQIRSGGQP